MSTPLPAAALRRHVSGLLATFTSAGPTDATGGAVWPVACGGAPSPMGTLPRVLARWTGRR